MPEAKQHANESPEKKALMIRDQLNVERVYISVLVGLTAGVFAAIIMVWVLLQARPELQDLTNDSIIFHEEFTDWETPETQLTAKDLPTFFWISLFGIIQTMQAVYMKSFETITGITRTLCLISIPVATTLCYRMRLKRYLEIDLRQAQLYDFNQNFQDWLERIKQWISVLCFLLATMLASYVFVSVILFLLSLAFPKLTLNLLFAGIVVTLIVASFTSIATFWATAMDCRQILLLGLATLMTGLVLSFALNDKVPPKVGDPYWWQIAVSAAGRYRPASPVFTSSFLAIVFAMIAVWFDLDTLLPVFTKKVLSERPNNRLVRIFNWLAGKIGQKPEHLILFIVGLLYLLIGIFLLMVGIIPMHTPEISSWHDNGAKGAGVFIFILTLILPKTPYYRRLYFYFSWLYIIVLPAAYLVNELDLISLTGMELIALFFIIVWIYTTFDGLIFYLNREWQTLELLDDRAKRYNSNYASILLCRLPIELI